MSNLHGRQQRINQNFRQKFREKSPFFFLFLAGLVFIFLFGIINTIFSLFPTATPEILVGEPVQNVEIKISSASYGKLDMAFGVTVPTPLTVADANTVLSFYPDSNIYLKVYNPTPDILNAQFDNLSQKGYPWYFSFSQNSLAENFMPVFFSRFPEAGPVVELPHLSKNQGTDIRISADDKKEYLSLLAASFVRAMTTSTKTNFFIYGEEIPTRDGKVLFSSLAKYAAKKPDIVWVGDNPLIGVVGKTNRGYHLLLINTSEELSIAADFNNITDLTKYQFYSTARGTGNFADSPDRITLSPLEVIIASPVLNEPLPPDN